MLRNAFASLRLRLILLVLLAILPLLGLFIFMHINQRVLSREYAQKNVLRLIRIATLEQEQLIVSTKQLLVAVAHLPSIRESDVEACQALFADLLPQYTFYSALSLANPQGDVICSAPPLSSPVSFSDRAWFNRVLQSKDFVVGEYVVGRISGKSIVVMAYPVLDASNNVQSIIAIGIDLSWLKQIMTKAALPEGSTYTVIDPQGVILAHDPDTEKWVGKPMQDDPLIEQILARGGDGIFEAQGLDGIQRLYVYAPLKSDPSSKEYVTIGIPKTVAYAETNSILATNLFGLGIVLVLVVLGAWFGGHVFVMRRVDLLMQASKRLQAGNLDARTGLAHGEGELNHLAQVFDQMAETLQLRDLETRQANETLSRLNRALRVISACDTALIRTEDEAELLDKICQLIVQVGGYRLAWVGYAGQDEVGMVRPVAQAGDEEGYLDVLNMTWADEERGQGPTGMAIRLGKPVIASDILTDPNFTPWRDESIKRGYASCIALPLLWDAQTLGVINVYAEEADAFDDEEVVLLEELSGDLAFGIVTLRVRAQHKQAQEKIRGQLENLAALRNIDMAITSSLDLRVIFNVLLDQVTNTLKVDAACILLFQPHTQMLAFMAGKGFRTKALQHTSLRVGEGHAGLAALERRSISISDLNELENGFQRSYLLSGEDFVSYFAVPLVARGHVKGVLEIFHRTRFEPDQEWMDFLESLAMQAAIALDNAALFDDLQQSNVELTLAYDTTLEGWSRALDLRDHETEGHTKRVTEMAVHLARAIQIDDEDVVQIRRGAVLHDIGKMGIPDSILLKPGPLTYKEWEIMRRHPTYAFELLSPIDYLRPALDIPYCHHEKWDGSGYPRGLKGEQIPLAARIFAVVDVMDALCSDRPYRKAWSKEKSLRYIREQSGMHFDPQVVGAFFRWLERDPA